PERARRADGARASAGAGGAARARARAAAEGADAAARGAGATRDTQPSRAVAADPEAAATAARDAAAARRTGAAVVGNAANRSSARRQDRGGDQAAGERHVGRGHRLGHWRGGADPRRLGLPVRVVPAAGPAEGRAGMAAPEPAQRAPTETADLRRDPARRLDRAAR